MTNARCVALAAALCAFVLPSSSVATSGQSASNRTNTGLSEECSVWHQICDALGNSFVENTSWNWYYKFDLVDPSWIKITNGVLHSSDNVSYLYANGAHEYFLCSEMVFPEKCSQVKKFFNGFETLDHKYALSIALTSDLKDTIVVMNLRDPNGNTTSRNVFQKVADAQSFMANAEAQREREQAAADEAWEEDSRAEQQHSSGPNAYQILRGMAGEAGAAADRSQRELQRTIDRSLGNSSGGSGSSASFGPTYSSPSGSVAPPSASQPFMLPAPTVARQCSVPSRAIEISWTGMKSQEAETRATLQAQARSACGGAGAYGGDPTAYPGTITSMTCNDGRCTAQIQCPSRPAPCDAAASRR